MRCCRSTTAGRVLESLRRRAEGETLPKRYDSSARSATECDRVRSEYHRILVSTGSLHGGQQTTILNLMVPLLRLGMTMVGVRYSTKALFTTQGGGSPYWPCGRRRQSAIHR